MSWLNFNDSINSLKGQLSNFASGVLTEGIVNIDAPGLTEAVGVSDAQERFTNIELGKSSNVLQQEPLDNWSWDSPKNSLTSGPTSKDEIICNLQKKVTQLETDKRELALSLEQLDFDCQQTTDKLVTLKDNIQVEYDELKSDYETLKEEYTTVMNENMTKSKELLVLKTNKGNEELSKLQDENNILNKQLMYSLKEVEAKNQLVEKCNELQKQCDTHLESLISEKLINEELQKLYNNLEDVNVSLTEKLTKYSKLEPDDLINEYKEMTLETANLALQQNSLIGENEELCATNNRLRNEITIWNNDYDTCAQQVNQLKTELKELQNFHNIQKQTNQELLIKIEEHSGNVKFLTHENEKLRSECLILKNDADNMNSNANQLINERNNLKSKYDDLTKSNTSLTNDYQQLAVRCDELKTIVNNVETTESMLDRQNEDEKYISIISDTIRKIVNTNNTSSVANNDPNMLQFAEKLDTELRPIVHYKETSEMFEKKISEIIQQKNEIVIEKNLEIEKLLQNSEILSQEVINKSHSLKDVEDECAELMKNSDLLLTELENYRKSSNLQTISESNEDNLLVLEIQLENANKRIQELETTIIESSNDSLDMELIKNDLSTTDYKEEFSELLSRYKQLEEDKLLLRSTLDKTKSDFENTEYKYTELTINFDSLQDENEQLKNKHSDLENQHQNLVSHNNSLENKLLYFQETELDLKQKLNFEIENNKDKDVQIKNFVERLQNSKMSETSWKLQVDTLHKEFQTLTETKQNLEIKLETCFKDFEKFKEEQTNNETTKEKQVQELISLVNSKHEESVKYHHEIQRLNLHLSTEIEKAAVLEKQLNDLSVDNISHEELTQKDEAIEKLNDQNSFLKEKCEVLAHNLLQEQSNVQNVVQERQTVIDRELALAKELERLREHLVEIEDVYTQELLLAEQKNKEMQMKVNEIEQREKDSNSIYTSVNIRANQQVETLQTQLQLVTNQREELRVTISDLEDKENKHVAALTNLQFVLEQFQRDKETDVEQETERIRRQIGVEKRTQEELRIEIAGLKSQLEESKQGLQAASRLSDQLEKTKQQTLSYKDEILKLQEQLQTYESKSKDLTSSSDMKVDKSLVKNLMLGYITSHPNDQKQILKVLATVLDFNEKESEKANLNKPSQGGWLSTILHPQSLQSNQGVNQQSLSEAFVRFLENESKPKVVPNLLIARQHSQDNSNNGNGQQRQSPHTLHEVVLPTFEDFGSNRSSSSILKGILKNNS